MGEAVKFPTMEFLVPRRAPVSRVAVFILADVAEVANGYLLYTFFDTPLHDVFRERVEEVVFASGEFLPILQRPLRRPVLAFGLVLLAGEVVLVLFQRVPRIQFRGAVLVVDGEIVADPEVDTCRVVTRCVFDRNLFLADEVEFPAVAVPDGTHLLDVLDFYVGASFVLHEDEVWPTLFQVEPFREAELAVLVVMLDGSFLPCHGGAWVSVATFPVSGWVVAIVRVVPAGERLSKFSENSLCSMSEAHWHHETAPPSRTNLTENGGHCSVRGLSTPISVRLRRVSHRLHPTALECSSVRRSTVWMRRTRTCRYRHEPDCGS